MTLLVYLLIGALVYFLVMGILVNLLKSPPGVIMAAKYIMAFIALLFLIALFFGVPYPAPRIHLN